MAETNGVVSEAGPSSDPQHQTQTRTPPPSNPASTSVDPTFQTSSLNDSGLSKRPRDARLIHMILANLGVNAYQERVPLQLMDLAYRYTSSVLQDALHLTAEAYGVTANNTGKGAAANTERYCLTGVGWGLREEWDSEGDVEVEVEADTGDHTMGGDADDNGEEEGDDKMEDVFGSDFEGEGEDKNMDDE